MLSVLFSIILMLFKTKTGGSSTELIVCSSNQNQVEGRSVNHVVQVGWLCEATVSINHSMKPPYQRIVEFAGTFRLTPSTASDGWR